MPNIPRPNLKLTPMPRKPVEEVLTVGYESRYSRAQHMLAYNMTKLTQLLGALYSRDGLVATTAKELGDAMNFKPEYAKILLDNNLAHGRLDPPSAFLYITEAGRDMYELIYYMKAAQ